MPVPNSWRARDTVRGCAKRKRYKMPLLKHVHNTEKAIEALAKNWYTEQRGKANGSTKDWAALTLDQKLNIMGSVTETLEYMEEYWQWE